MKQPAPLAAPLPSRPVHRPLLLLTTVTLLLSACGSPTPPEQAAELGRLSATQKSVNGGTDLGTRVTVFDPSMPVAKIQAILDETYAKQVDNEMGSERYAYLFRPGTYGTAEQPLQIKVGYYTEISGLGASPQDVVINGKVEVYNRCLGDGGTSNCIALVNFWRTVSNLTVQVNGAGQDGCRGSANFWAVSQAVSMRRINIQGGNLSLMDYCTAGPQFASGGFLADSKTAFIINGSQQQWLTRNSTIGGWSNGVWNQVFAGVEGAPDDTTFPNPPYTTLAATPVSREKPYLYLDAQGNYQVRVPSAQTNSRGTSWAAGMTPGQSLPLSDFYVATPADSVQVINNQLTRGRNLLLTPGVYDVAQSISVKRANTVVLGIGHATLTAVGGAVPLTVADVPGVIIAGVTVDAGTTTSPVLLQVGKKNGNNGARKVDPADPVTLSDVYFRVGGPHIGKAETALEVNSDHVLIDHTWVWRADHGIEGFSGDTERWNTNRGRNGVIINGDHVTATGLFVEHFQEYNTIWNGENGTTVLYQNELPYDPPTQADWMNGSVEGWAGYKVGNQVKTHQLFGGGVYVFNQNNPSIHTENGFEVPQTPGVKLRHIMTVNLSAGTVDHVVNGVGAAADTSKVGIPVYITEYPLP
ncbi:glycoside hydrolase family 55 protein [Deinococcus sp. QL22]|uniref:glycoside hydrolase family 55 protein n=1 Tax=Deinococcus sp. QL22 TaxID=2939437 RepID=UPI0020183C03|nr:glycoside hydrolase family 55 protein [Deinococcus sp. QL22]UQN08950.1 glycoside hydrolase family 55 protein [Deinococcus sp. QL22]